MNVAAYITDKNDHHPTIHESSYIDEFKTPYAIHVAAPETIPFANDIRGGKTFKIFQGDRIHLDDFRVDAADRINAGHHPWDVFGNQWGSPLDFKNEAAIEYNPKNLSEKEIHLARMKEQAGTANEFSVRLENLDTGVPLNEIRAVRAEEGEYQNELNKLKSGLKTAFKDDPAAIATEYEKQKKPIDTKHHDRKGMIKEDFASSRAPRHQKVVVEPVVPRPAAAAARTSAGASAATVPDAAFMTPVRPRSSEKSKKDDSGSDEEEPVDFTTPQKGTKEYHARLDTLEQISGMLTEKELTEKDVSDARELFATADIHLSKNVKTQLGLVKAYNKRIDALVARGDIDAKQFPKIEEKRRRAAGTTKEKIF